MRTRLGRVVGGCLGCEVCGRGRSVVSSKLVVDIERDSHMGAWRC